MWNVAAPATISTSCSAVRSSSVTESPGSERIDVDQQPRRQHDGALADDLAVERHAQADLHVGRPELDRAGRGQDLHAGERLHGAAGRGGAGHGLQLREQRVALRGKFHLVACFTVDSDEHS